MSSSCRLCRAVFSRYSALMPGTPDEKTNAAAMPHDPGRAPRAPDSLAHWLAPDGDLPPAHPERLGRLNDRVLAAHELSISQAFLHTHHAPLGAVVTLNGR